MTSAFLSPFLDLDALRRGVAFQAGLPVSAIVNSRELPAERRLVDGPMRCRMMVSMRLTDVPPFTVASRWTGLSMSGWAHAAMW